MKKLITILLLTAGWVNAGSDWVYPTDHFNTQFLDVYTQFRQEVPPHLPVLWPTGFRAAITIKLTDPSAGALVVDGLILLMDGSNYHIHRMVPKNPFDAPVRLDIGIGDTPPISWQRLNITRLRDEPADQLVKDLRK